MKNKLSYPSLQISESHPLFDLYTSIDWSNICKESTVPSIDLLQIYLNNILHTEIPSCLFWGTELKYFYNSSWSNLFSLNQFLFGKPAKEVFEINWKKLYPEFKKVITGHDSIEIQNLLTPPNNEDRNRYKTTRFSLNPLFSSDDRVIGVLAVMLEINKESGKNPTETLLASKGAAIIECMSDGLILADLEGNIIYENPAALKLLGYSDFSEVETSKEDYRASWEVNDILGNPVPFNEWPLVRVLNGDEFADLELEIKHKTLKTHFIGSFFGIPIKDNNGQSLFTLLTLRDITSIKAAEFQFKKESLLLQTIYDKIPIMLSIYDPRLQKITLNAHFERVTGWTKEDTEKTNIMNLVYPDPEYRQIIGEYMQSLKEGFKDIIMVTKDGREIITSWANVMISDGRQVGIGIDISERVKVEKQLQFNSARLAFLNEIDAAILSAHSESSVAKAVVERIPELLPHCIYASVTTINHEVDEFSLLASSDPKDENKKEVWPMLDPTIWEPIRAKFLAGNPLDLNSMEKLPVSSEYKSYLDQKGVQQLTFYPIIIENELVGTLNLGINKRGSLNNIEIEIIEELLIPLTFGIEHERLHEKALEMNRRLLETIINNIPVAISLIRGSDFRVLFANPTYYTIAPGSHLIGKTLDQIWQDKNTDFLSLCQVTLKTMKPYYQEDDTFTLTRKLGDSPEKAYFSWWFFPVEIPDEDQMGILNIAYETTDRKNAEQALIDAERLSTIGRMAASLAHEINNPIQSVVGCLGLAIENVEIGKNPTQLMDVAMEELIRASRIIQRLHDLGKKQKVVKAPTDINEVLKKVLLLTKKQVQDQNVNIVYNSNKKLPNIPLISDQIHQVFLNLVLNAIEAMPDGGSLKIKCVKTSHPNGIKVSFIDSGKGIPKDELDKLFAAFHSTKRGGLGLGLFVSKSIVHEHGGEMSVTSEIGKGATFTVWLPGDDVIENITKDD